METWKITITFENTNTGTRKKVKARKGFPDLTPIIDIDDELIKEASKQLPKGNWEADLSNHNGPEEV
jgi:hypothetical protein